MGGMLKETQVGENIFYYFTDMVFLLVRSHGKASSKQMCQPIHVKW